MSGEEKLALLCPPEVRSLAHAVLSMLERPRFLDISALAALAAEVSIAMPIERVVLLIGQEDGLHTHGPVAPDGSCSPGAPGALLLDDREPVGAHTLPARPVCVESPAETAAFARALRALGLASFTILPLLDRNTVLGALVLGHPSGEAPASILEAGEDTLLSIGSHIGTAIALHRLSAGDLTQDDFAGEEPSTAPVTAARGEAGTPTLRQVTALGRRSSMGILAGGLIHEVSNPAAFIALAGGQIKKLASRAKSAQGCEGLNPVIDLAEEVLQSIRQIENVVSTFRLLVDVSNQANVVTVDLTRMLETTVRLTHVALRHDAALEVDLQPMSACPGSCIALVPAVINVLVNAIESFDDSISPKKVRVTGRLQDAMVRIEVHDTGGGIPDDELPRIFDPGFTSRSSDEHAGLGLTVAREILLAFGGKIDVKSQKNMGTAVYMEAPIPPMGESSPADGWLGSP